MSKPIPSYITVDADKATVTLSRAYNPSVRTDPSTVVLRQSTVGDLIAVNDAINNRQNFTEHAARTLTRTVTMIDGLVPKASYEFVLGLRHKDFDRLQIAQMILDDAQEDEDAPEASDPLGE